MPIKIIKKRTSRPATLADVLQRIHRRAGLRETERRDLVSAVTSAARLLHRQPCELEADIATLRPRLLAVHSVAARISTKRLANIKAGLTKALQISGAAPELLPRVDPSTEWKAFLEHANAPHQAYALARLARYCTAHDIAPSAMHDETMVAFHAYLDARLLNNDPARLCKAVAQTWNGIVRRNGLDVPQLTIPRTATYRSAALSVYPASLREDIERYLDRLRSPDLFSEEGLDKPLRPMTLRNIEAHVRQLLDAAVTAGYDPQGFQCLADLVEVDVLNAAFGEIESRIGREAPATLHNIAATILAVARHHVGAPKDIVAKIGNAKKKIATRLGNGQPQMSEKNMERLAQFDEMGNVWLLVTLPKKLVTRAAKNPDSPRAALDAMYAVAIAILLACPIRIANLAALDMEQNVTVFKKGPQRRYSIRVEGGDVKNGNAIDFDLDMYASRIFSRYLDKHRHRLSTKPGTALFPRHSGGPRDPKHLGDDLKRLIWRESGLTVNAHLFRHLAGMLFLKQHPGEYETVRRLLGHRKLETTMAFYARFDSKWAVQRYDEQVLAEYRSL